MNKTYDIKLILFNVMKIKFHNLHDTALHRSLLEAVRSLHEIVLAL